MIWSIVATAVPEEVAGACEEPDDGAGADASGAGWVSGVVEDGVVWPAVVALSTGAVASALSRTALVLAGDAWVDEPMAAVSPAPPPPQADKIREKMRVEGIAMRFKSLLLKLRIGDYLH